MYASAIVNETIEKKFWNQMNEFLPYARKRKSQHTNTSSSSKFIWKGELKKYFSFFSFCLNFKVSVDWNYGGESGRTLHLKIVPYAPPASD